MSTTPMTEGDTESASDNPHPNEYNLYLGFMIPIGAILLVCIFCLLVISWQIMCPKCSATYCPKFLLTSKLNSNSSNLVTVEPQETHHSSAGRRTSLTFVHRYNDFPPNYKTLNSDLPPSYDSVVIIEEEASPGDRRSRSSGIRTYVYDPTRRVSIEIHDEDTIRVVEELLSRRRSSMRSASESSDHMIYV